MNIIWIDDADELAQFCDAIPPGDVVAVDTESDHFLAYNAKVALIQLATREVAALIDPLALTVPELEPFFELLEAPSVTKILHSCRNDIRELDRDFRVEVVNVFDTQLAARFAGHDSFGLRALLDDNLDVQISKKYQRYDWTRRPIPEEPRRYAAGDVVHLFELRATLLEEIEAAGWTEAFEQQCAYVAANSRYEPSAFDPTDWRRLKGTKNADARTRAALRALFEWRHELCERLNRAALHVFENRAMIRVAKVRPTTRDELEQIKGLRDATLRHNADEILRVVRESLDADAPPERLPRTGDGPSREERSRQKALTRLRSELHADVGLPRHLLFNRDALEEIARREPRTIEELGEVSHLLEWQLKRFGHKILEAIG